MVKKYNIKNFENIWLTRYMEFDRWSDWFDNKSFSISFSRIDLFSDSFEGIFGSSDSFRIAWENYIMFSSRVLEDGGTIEHGRSFITTIESLVNIPNQDINFNPNYLESYINLIQSNYASCWFMSDDPLKEERYMWDLYVSSKNNNFRGEKKLGFMISISLKELTDSLNLHPYQFICGNVNYKKMKDGGNPLFYKHNSYKHEKEFRIICSNFENKKGSIELNNITKHIIFNRPIDSKTQEIINKSINIKTDNIYFSKLPIHFKLSEIIKYL